MTAFHPLDKDIVLQLKDVSFAYNNYAVFDEISFHVHQGEFVALSGANGTGKTTILKLILGLECPTAGSLSLLGNDPRKVRDRVGYVPQLSGFDKSFPISVKDVVKMGRLRPLSRRYTEEDRQAVEDAIDQVDIADLCHRSYTALSGGQRRRVLVARALAAKPALLILDEPTANMDVESEDRLYNTLESLKNNTTILIVTHDTGFVSSLTDRVLCLEKQNHAGKCNIVQHRTETKRSESYDLYSPQKSSLILHGTSIPSDDCYDEGEGKNE
jgi:zinc transport system ATP-binding protein